KRVVESFERNLEVVLFEWWAAAGVAEEVAEDAVVEDSEGAADDHLAVALGIKSETYARFDVGKVIVVQHVPGAGTDQRIHDWESVGRAEQVGEVGMLLVRNSVELVAEAEVQREVAKDFPRVLSVEVVFMLAEEFVVGGLTDAVLVE